MLRASKTKTCGPFSSIWKPSTKVNVLLFGLWFKKKKKKSQNLLCVKIIFMENETQPNVSVTK